MSKEVKSNVPAIINTQKNTPEVVHIEGIDGYEKDGVVYLNLEAVARGLGFTRTAASGNEVVRWSRVESYLKDFGVSTCGHDGFIPENIFYRLAMKAKNSVAESFQAKVADVIIPSIRRTGGYIAGEERMTEEQLMAQAVIVAQRKIDKMEHKIQLLEEENADLLPDATMARDIMKTDGLYTLKDTADILGIGRNNMCKFLRLNGVFCKKYRSNIPYHNYLGRGFFQRKAAPGTPVTLVTQKGLKHIYKMVKSDKGVEYFSSKSKKAV